MKKKTKQNIRQAILIVAVHIGLVAWLFSGIITATTLR